MDLKFALRSLRSHPGFTVLAIAILALGIGANTAIFSVVNSVLLRPLEYRDPARLVMIGNDWRDGSASTMTQVSEPDFDDLRSQSTQFDGVAAYMGGGTASSSVIVNNSAEFAGVTRTTEDFFHVMSVEPERGRLITSEEYQFGGPNVVVVSHDFWIHRLASDPNALGTELRAYGRPFKIIGILPPGFNFPSKTDVWVGAIEAKNTSRSAHNWRAIARLKPGVTVERAQTELDTIGSRLSQAYPLSNKNVTLHAMPVQEQIVSGVKTTLWILLGSVGMVLLIACANVANLLLIRASARRREIAVRAALGARRWHIIRQLGIESALIAIVSGIAGIMLASWGMSALLHLAPANLPRVEEVRLDMTVLVFTMLLSLAASVVFGLVPALKASRVDLSDALKQGARGATVGDSRGLRGALVVAEIAISMILLIGAGLLIRSFDRLTRVDLGYRPDHLLVINSNLPAETIEDARRSNLVYGKVAAQIGSIPGIVSASAAMGLVGGPPRSNGGYYLEGGPDYYQLGMTGPQGDFFVIMPDYFRTIGVPLHAGRDFDARDQFDRGLTVVVNEALVRRSFPNENPIGRRINCGMDNSGFMTIVGVVADFRNSDPARPPRPGIFMPYLQHPFFATRMTFIARTAGDPSAMTEIVRKKVAEVSTDLPVQFSTLDDRLAATVASPRFRSTLLGVFAGIALLLAMAGVYGVMAYTVSQRTQELGLRVALGADRGRIIRLVLSGGLKFAVMGLAIGLLGAWAATRLLGAMLFEVGRNDPATYLAMGAGVMLITIAASVIPAWRASRIDPIEALRQE
ncbi:MAG TPA: ABC transporter permease [Bryobacteraceae bacterium]|jgi:predicted permease